MESIEPRLSSQIIAGLDSDSDDDASTTLHFPLFTDTLHRRLEALVQQHWRLQRVRRAYPDDSSRMSITDRGTVAGSHRHGSARASLYPPSSARASFHPSHPASPNASLRTIATPLPSTLRRTSKSTLWGGDQLRRRTAIDPPERSLAQSTPRGLNDTDLPTESFSRVKSLSTEVSNLEYNP